VDVCSIIGAVVFVFAVVDVDVGVVASTECNGCIGCDVEAGGIVVLIIIIYSLLLLLLLLLLSLLLFYSSI
jgi:hypothetical protein